MAQKGRPKNSEIDAKVMIAMKHFLENNNTDFTMEMVAKEASIAKQTLYTRFHSKLELLLYFLEYTAQERITIHNEDRLIEKIKSVIYPAIEYTMSKDSILLKLIALEALKNKDCTKLIKDSFMNNRRNLLIKVFDEAKENKEISQTLNSATLCDMIFGCLWYRMIFDINEDSEAKKSISNILELLTLTK